MARRLHLITCTTGVKKCGVRAILGLHEGCILSHVLQVLRSVVYEPSWDGTKAAS